MKYCTETIPVTLAKKLKEKGMPIEMQPTIYAQIAPNVRGIIKAGVGLWCPSYAECFDWLMGKGLSTEVYGCASGYDFVICKECDDATRGTRKSKPNYDGPNDGGCWDTWHEAANAAIEKALELIK